MTKESALKILTIGHSIRTLDEFIELLKTYGVNLLVDVRTVPRSRHNPQFNKETLPNTLKKHDIKYIHMPDIGGLRRPKYDSINLAWKNKQLPRLRRLYANQRIHRQPAKNHSARTRELFGAYVR